MKDYLFEQRDAETNDEFGNVIERLYSMLFQDNCITIKAYEKFAGTMFYEHHVWHLQLNDQIDHMQDQIMRLACDNDYDYSWSLNHFPEKYVEDIDELLYGTLTKPCR